MPQITQVLQFFPLLFPFHISFKQYYTILNFSHVLYPCVSSNTLPAAFQYAVSREFKAEAGWLSVCVNVVVVWSIYPLSQINKMSRKIVFSHIYSGLS